MCYVVGGLLWVFVLVHLLVVVVLDAIACYLCEHDFVYFTIVCFVFGTVFCGLLCWFVGDDLGFLLC